MITKNTRRALVAIAVMTNPLTWAAAAVLLPLAVLVGGIGFYVWLFKLVRDELRKPTAHKAPVGQEGQGTYPPRTLAPVNEGKPARVGLGRMFPALAHRQRPAKLNPVQPAPVVSERPIEAPVEVRPAVLPIVIPMPSVKQETAPEPVKTHEPARDEREERLERALQLVLKEGLAIRAAAKREGVPYGTLRARVSRARHGVPVAA